MKKPSSHLCNTIFSPLRKAENKIATSFSLFIPTAQRTRLFYPVWGTNSGKYFSRVDGIFVGTSAVYSRETRIEAELNRSTIHSFLEVWLQTKIQKKNKEKEKNRCF